VVLVSKVQDGVTVARNLDIRILIDVDGQRWSNGAIQNPSADYLPYLQKLSGGGGSVHPQECRAEIRMYSFGILDKDDVVTSWLATDQYNAAVSIYIGDSETDESDFELLFKGVIADYEEAKLVWTFACNDLRRSIKTSIFTTADEDTSVTISGNPLDLVMQILTSTGAGTNGTYDTLAETNGRGIDDDLIDIATIEEIRDSYFPTLDWSFTLLESWEAKDFIESQIMLPLGLYLTTKNDGSISMKRVAPPLLADNPVHLNEDNIIGIPRIKKKLPYMINEIVWKRDYDSTTDEWGKHQIYINSDSLNKYKFSKQLTIESYAATGDITDTLVADRNSRLDTRFADPYPVYDISAQWSDAKAIEEGEVIFLSHPKMAVLATGKRGVSAEDPLVCEVVSAVPNVMRGTVAVTAIGTPWNFGARYVVISNLDIGYEAASTVQRTKYGWIGKGYKIMPG
jgi:hypothetical protein